MAENQDKTGAITGEAQDFLSQKLEKIAHAIYLITSSFPHDEPLRSALRDLSLSLLRVRESLIGGMSHNTESVYNLSDMLSELGSLIGLARASRLISEANAVILERELNALREVGKDLYGDPLLSAGDLSVSTDKKALKSANVQGGAEKKGDKSSAKAQKNSSGTPGVSKAKKNRRDAILEVLSDTGEVGIKEISKEVRGCSRKTIQRELSTLTDKGLVVKEGERRWSTYRLSPEGRAVAGL